jgi:hypothetical protein
MGKVGTSREFGYYIVYRCETISIKVMTAHPWRRSTGPLPFSGKPHSQRDTADETAWLDGIAGRT